jgi:prepilin-type processing-associated H-X9-DG protein
MFPHGTFNRLVGPQLPDRRCWFHPTLPYVEQQALGARIEAFMADLARQNGTDTVAYRVTAYAQTNQPGARQPVNPFMCPSDPANPKVATAGPDTNQQGFHGNYVACAGSTFFVAGSVAPANPPSRDGTTLNGIFYAWSKTRIADVTDGTSNTLMFAELILSPDAQPDRHDARGRYYNNSGLGTVLFSTLYPPNTSVPDQHNFCQGIPRAPCSQTNTDIVVSARSYHSGGVNVVLADGSVRSISDGVNATVYNNLGSRAGGEVPGDY